MSKRSKGKTKSYLSGRRAKNPKQSKERPTTIAEYHAMVESFRQKRK